MGKTKAKGGFFLCLLINMLLNWQGIIPATILLILHFWLGWSLWWAALALALWILGLLFWMKVVGWAGDCSRLPDPPKENKNPYSADSSNRSM